MMFWFSENDQFALSIKLSLDKLDPTSEVNSKMAYLIWAYAIDPVYLLFYYPGHWRHQSYNMCSFTRKILKDEISLYETSTLKTIQPLMKRQDIINIIDEQLKVFNLMFVWDRNLSHKIWELVKFEDYVFIPHESDIVCRCCTNKFRTINYKTHELNLRYKFLKCIPSMKNGIHTIDVKIKVNVNEIARPESRAFSYYKPRYRWFFGIKEKNKKFGACMLESTGRIFLFRDPIYTINWSQESQILRCVCDIPNNLLIFKQENDKINTVIIPFYYLKKEYEFAFSSYDECGTTIEILSLQ